MRLNIERRLGISPDRLMRLRWLRFGVVGGIGFALDSVVLAVLYHGFAFGALGARGQSFSLAVLVTWLLNRTYTFGVNNKSALHLELLRYVLVNAVGLVVNVGVYAVAVTNSSYLQRRPVIALALAAALAATANYIGSARFAFGSHRD